MVMPVTVRCVMCGGYFLSSDAVSPEPHCDRCIEESEKGRDEIRKSLKEGHTYHCAARMAWGDGECECGLTQYLIKEVG